MQDEVVLITGANQGIGLGLAKALATEGFHVVGLDLSLENLTDMEAYLCDVTKPAQIQDVVGQIIEKWGRIDILINNACLAVFSRFEDKPLKETRREFEVNYYGYINMIQAVLPQMKAQGGGVIHNFSSTVGTSGFAGIYGYASTKGAVEALTRTLAIELAPYRITVNIVHPPLTRTKSSAPLGVPPQFMADPDEVGRKLARKIGSRKAILTPGLAESVGVLIATWMPGFMGRFMSEKAAQARRDA